MESGLEPAGGLKTVAGLAAQMDKGRIQEDFDRAV